MISSRASPRAAAAAAAILLLLALRPESAPAQSVVWGGAVDSDVQPVDSGRFDVTVAGRAVGVEEFRIQTSGDSLIATAILSQYHPGDGFTDTLFKKVRMVADAFDYGLRTYQSQQLYKGRTVERGITVQDTSYTSFRQTGGSGDISSFALPPGRVFVLDPPVFTNFNAICLNLKNRVFQTRPVTMLMMTPTRDTVITATAVDIGRQTIRWAGRPVVARHVTLGDSAVTYDIWMAEDGRMLRLEHEGTRLRVERAAPTPARRPARRPRARG